jgi:hypothetical protein
VPEAHTLHFAAPVSAEYLPVAHKEQLVEPDAAWLEPAAQLVHDDDSAAEYFPAAQSLHALEPLNEYVPLPQYVQLVAPVEV